MYIFIVSTHTNNQLFYKVTENEEKYHDIEISHTLFLDEVHCIYTHIQFYIQIIFIEFVSILNKVYLFS